ncbi:MAG: hypothetical protein ACK557_20815, partial [Planctomycetota bacterium]
MRSTSVEVSMVPHYSSYPFRHHSLLALSIALQLMLGPQLMGPQLLGQSNSGSFFADSSAPRSTDLQKVYILQHRTASELEVFLVEMLPARRYNFKVVRNARDERKVSVMADSMTLELVTDLVTSFDLPGTPAAPVELAVIRPRVRKYQPAAAQLDSVAEQWRRDFATQDDFSL